LPPITQRRDDLARESKELATTPEREHPELTAIYVKRGLDAALASSVANQLKQHAALGAHARDEPVISAATRVTFWGALAMALTAGVGALFGVAA